MVRLALFLFLLGLLLLMVFCILRPLLFFLAYIFLVFLWRMMGRLWSRVGCLGRICILRSIHFFHMMFGLSRHILLYGFLYGIVHFLDLLLIGWFLFLLIFHQLGNQSHLCHCCFCLRLLIFLVFFDMILLFSLFLLFDFYVCWHGLLHGLSLQIHNSLLALECFQIFDWICLYF